MRRVISHFTSKPQTEFQIECTVDFKAIHVVSSLNSRCEGLEIELQNQDVSLTYLIIVVAFYDCDVSR